MKIIYSDCLHVGDIHSLVKIFDIESDLVILSPDAEQALIDSLRRWFSSYRKRGEIQHVGDNDIFIIF